MENCCGRRLVGPRRWVGREKRALRTKRVVQACPLTWHCSPSFSHTLWSWKWLFAFLITKFMKSVFWLRIKHARNQTGLEVVLNQFDFSNRFAAKTMWELVRTGFLLFSQPQTGFKLILRLLILIRFDSKKPWQLELDFFKKSMRNATAAAERALRTGPRERWRRAVRYALLGRDLEAPAAKVLGTLPPPLLPQGSSRITE